MKKAKAPKKLALSRETLLQLTRQELEQAGGAGWSDDSVCPTTTPSDCKACN